MKLPVGLLLVALGSVTMAQSGHIAVAGERGAGSDESLTAGPRILSDTEGLDFAPYLRRMRSDLKQNWDALIPEEAKPPKSKKGVVGIRFAILPDGTIGSVKLETSSGDVLLDKAAWEAITSEKKFPALPTAFRGPELDVRVGFFYNIPTAGNGKVSPAP